MTCALRSVLAALLMLALSAMPAGDPLAAGVDPEPPHSHAMQHGAGGVLDHHDHGAVGHDRSCASMIGHCGTLPLHDAAASPAVQPSVLPATLPPDDVALLGRSPEADTPPPRV